MRRVYGPYDRGERYAGKRFRIAIVDGRGAARTTRYETFATRSEAERWLDGASDQAQGTTVRHAVDVYLDDCRARDLASTTVERYEHHLWNLLGVEANGHRPMRWVQGRGGELHVASCAGRRPDTHTGALLVGRTWAKWCIEQRLLKSNPFAAVKPRGRRTPGATKPRLKVDECRVLEEFCIAHQDEPDCVLTYAYLMLGKRASELVNARVSDLDDDGWLLRITKAKSAASVKAVPLNAVLRGMLQDLVAARTRSPGTINGGEERKTSTLTLPTSNGLGGPALFIQGDGSPMSRYTARDRVKAVLKRAGVTVLPPQALRRTYADLGTIQGRALTTVAEALGHTSSSVTARSYASAEAVDGARTERVFAVINGGKR